MSSFVDRHIGPDHAAERVMLDAVGCSDLDSLIDAAVPSAIRDAEPLALPAARTEHEALAALRAIAQRNRPMVQMIGLGYSDTVTPSVIRRNMLESPAWYTAYTPYQPEISQGRLEALLNFQTMVEDLTALPVAGASLLDEASAAAEAMLLMARANRKSSGPVVVDADALPQTLAVLRRRAEPMDLALDVRPLRGPADLPDGPLLGVILQSPGASGEVRDTRAVIAAAKQRGALVTVAADLLALTMLAPPGELGADVAIGSAQRFGVPLFYGGPHAAYMSVRAGLERMLPGRLVGVSTDSAGRPGYRLALQTREQHIRREKATSNICTAQALLANVAAMYAVYHGPDGLRAIAERVHAHAVSLASGLRAAGVEVVHEAFFDTVLARVPGRAARVLAAAEADGINLRLVDADHVAIACDEVTTADIIHRVLHAFPTPTPTPPASRRSQHTELATSAHGPIAEPCAENDNTVCSQRRLAVPDAQRRLAIPDSVRRTSGYLAHPVFHAHRSETAMLRYLRALSDKDLALDRTMIPLGSCTMKLNAAAEMEPISWPEFASLHPYAPADQALGYAELVDNLTDWLARITGYDTVSLQPNAGSQGELAGLLAIRDYHRSLGDDQRTVCLIPRSAHGTNAASAVLAGLRVVVVDTASDGSIELGDLRAKLAEHGETVAAIMLTYPSTHGVYEPEVRTVCRLVHEAGGQVYIDGANLNALVGLARPGTFGGDVSHLNLHKTFCIPHGGGGPGVGPIAARAHLAPFLPGDPLADEANGGGRAVTAARHGSAGILPITWMYLAMMGPDGLTRATRSAVLSANYLAARLAPHFPVLYAGPGGLVAHECILDLRELTARTGVTAEDVAKRLIDYGFHAPTLSFPVAGTLMVEPTESEPLEELDRFIEAMAAIRAEIEQVANGTWPLADSPLRNAPHPAEALLTDKWTLPYTREQAAYPVPGVRTSKYWPPIGRIDGAKGDRNLICACPAPDAFAEASR